MITFHLSRASRSLRTRNLVHDKELHVHKVLDYYVDKVLFLLLKMRVAYRYDIYTSRGIGTYCTNYLA
jgi:hypothetical protein